MESELESAAAKPEPDPLDEPRLMAETGVAARVAHLVAPALRELDLRLVRVRVTAANGQTLQIMAERADGSMSVGDCERASGLVSPLIDAENLFAHAYHFEMSSPGIDRPLVRLSDFRRAIGHEARIELAAPLEGRKRFRGWIEGVSGDGVDGTVSLRRIDVNVDEEADFVLPLREVAEARLVLTEALIRQALREDKAARHQLGGDEAAPRPEPPGRGPGRFARRSDRRPAAPSDRKARRSFSTHD